eukprot:jgi/Botrbrau1/15205/Bobra.0149s0064.1
MKEKVLNGSVDGFDGGIIPSIKQEPVPFTTSEPMVSSGKAKRKAKSSSMKRSRSMPCVKPPAWYTPHRLMAIFCYVFFICYFDMGLFASNGVTGTEAANGTVVHPGLKQAFHLTNTKLGLLPTLFIIGIMLSSGVLAVLANHFNAFRLVGVGMAIWCLGIVLVGAAQEFYSLAVGRILVGCGEASVMMLAGPFIDDVAPQEHRTMYLSFLTIFVPVGQALGSMAGQLVHFVNWRILFFIVAGLGGPVALFCLLAPPVDLKGAQEQIWDPEHAPQELARLGRRATIVKALKEAWADMVILHKHPVFVTSIYGYIPVQAVSGGLGFWVPKATMQIFNATAAKVDMTIGLVVLFTAITGLLGGGFLLDKLGSTLYKGMLISTIASAVGAVILVLGFALVRRINIFFVVAAFGLLSLYTAGSPLYAISMWSIPKQQRPASQAVRVISHHLFGDIPAPALIGLAQDHIHNWRITCGGLCLTLVIAAAAYALGTCYARNAPDYRTDHDICPEALAASKAPAQDPQ